MLCPLWVEPGPFEPCGLYRLIVQLWLRPSSVMSQHSRERINELVLGQMSSVVNAAGNSGSKGTSITVQLCKHFPALTRTPTRFFQALRLFSLGEI